MVMEVVYRLLAENQSQVSRALDGLRAVVNAALADPATYPKDVILLSSGFTLGRASHRSDQSFMLENIIKEANRGRIRVQTLDASGLDVDEPIGLRSNGSFLVRNPHLMGILTNHVHSWRMDRQSSLSQLASETGGRFLHSSNDLAAAAVKLIGARGRLYYLGFLSRQSADGRFHAVRVTVSSPAARIYARRGYFAGKLQQQEGLAESDSGSESREALLARANSARERGDFKELASALELLVRRIPGQVSLWYNLGIAQYRIGDYQRAVEVLQQAFALSSEDRAIGLALARALIAAGYRTAAAETLQFMVRRRPRDIELRMDLGRAYEAASNVEHAYQVYRQILDFRLAPPLDIYLLLTRTSLRLGRNVEAGIFMNDYIALGGSESAIAAWRKMLPSHEGNISSP
jgi:tetratricopeptide (TPR) repeat protein